MLNLGGKVAIVTGAGRERGIGRAIAVRLAQEGARLVITDVGAAIPAPAPGRPETTVELEQRASEIRALGAEVLAMRADVTRADDVERLVTETVRAFGRIDILSNNAGVVRLGSALDLSEPDWQFTFDVNSKGTWLCCKAVANVMLRNGWSGKIVNMSSQSGRKADVLQPAYNASKAAVIMLTQCLAQQLARHGITVNAVCPGVIDTQLQDMALQWRAEHDPPSPGDTADQIRARMVREIPMRRMGTPEEVASLVAFLVSDEASYITGQAININGGQLMS